MKNKSQTVRIEKGNLYKNMSPLAKNSKGEKTYLCWPRLESLAWFKDVKDVLKAGDTPRWVTHQNGKFTWHWKLSCYHGDEGWWYDWDDARNTNRGERFRLFIPSKLEFHPDYEARSDKK